MIIVPVGLVVQSERGQGSFARMEPGQRQRLGLALAIFGASVDLRAIRCPRTPLPVRHRFCKQ